jgi:hypothetical protein
MIKKRNWTIPAIISGIIFFTMIGYLLSSGEVNISDYSKTIVVYWCIGLSFASLLCLILFKTETYKESKNKLLEKVLLFPISLVFTAIQIELNFFPIFTFFIFVICWILWAIYRSQNNGNKLTFLNIMIISWMVLSLTVTVGQFIGYSNALVSKIYGFNIFLDFRITFSIVIAATILVISLGKIDFSKIETKELLKIKNAKGNPLVIIAGLFFILANFLIQIGWWIGTFILLWGQECVSEIKKKSIENRNTLFDVSIILFSIIGLYISYILSKYLVLDYFSINKTIKEILPFIYSAMLVCLILLAASLIVRIRHLSWDNWKLVLNKSEFDKSDRHYREAIAFPILTSGLAGIILYGLSKITTLEFNNFNNYGVFSWFLSIGLFIAIVITLLKHLSNSNEIDN